MSLGDKIRMVRQESKLSQKALGQMTGVSKQAISLIEKGVTKEPDKRTLILLVQALNNDFGDPKLTEYLSSENNSNRLLILNSATPKEVTNTLKFNAGSGRYTKEELLDIKKQMELALKEIDKRNAESKLDE